ncbi:MAG: RIP metalloprotease RseP [Nitrospiraceae bacterium]
MTNLTSLAFSPDAIWVLLQKAWWFLVVLGVLVAFHELGHFLAARWVGVKVLKFSLGFGPRLFSRQAGETEYLLSAIPLGGYVKLFGEEEAEALTPDDRRRSFVHQDLWKKMLIVAAGPGFNFILAYLVYTGVLAFGYAVPVPSFKDIVSEIEAVMPGSPADAAGLKAGDRIIRVNDRDVSTSTELHELVVKSNGKPLTIDVRRQDQVKTYVVTPASGDPMPDGAPSYRLGIEERAPVVTGIVPGSPAALGGFQEGDRVTRIGTNDIHTWSQMTNIVREHANKPLEFAVLRRGAPVTLTVTPSGEKATVDGKTIEYGRIGISAQSQSVIQAATPWSVPVLGAVATWRWTELTTVGIYKMFTGEISSKNIGGPLTIANISGEAASQGTSSLVFLIAMLSINLGVLNLLPIPILDGGHLFFFALEGILRKPLGERQREIAQQVGLVLLVGIMVFAFWNDLERIFLR